MEEGSTHNIPEQEKGAHKDLKEHITLETLEDAEDMFIIAKERMLGVNDWHKLAGSGLNAEFQLTDTHAHELSRHAHRGDHIRIRIPGPGNEAGDGYDWVFIESIEYDDYPDEGGEIISMRVRPTAAPAGKSEETAHFFTADATSTFSIERHNRMIIAHYHGRNEVPNITDNSIVDNARNTLVAIGAILGLSDLQWTALIKNFIELPEQ